VGAMAAVAAIDHGEAGAAPGQGLDLLESVREGILSGFTPISTARPEMSSQPMLLAEWRAPHLRGEDEASDDDWL
jgi:hypothetical protein